MKVMILAGGLGTRLGEETGIRPKPMVGIGDHPILWHIMKIYSHYGFNDFIVLTGYKHEVIKDYFVNYYMNNSDVTIDLQTNSTTIHKNISEPWKVTLCYTGKNTMTGSRIKKAREYVGNEPFMLTYGDGVSDINIPKLVEFHKRSAKIATLTAIQPRGKFGALLLDDRDNIFEFHEKPQGDGSWINGGFFVLEPAVFDYIPDGDDIMFERAPLSGLAAAGELNAYKHNGFWQPMDMLRDKEELNKLWTEGKAPWKVWEK